MNLNTIFTIFRKDLKYSIKNRTILIVVIMPLLLSLVFSTAFSSTGSMAASIALYDEGANTEFVEYLGSIENYNIIIAESAEKSRKLVEEGDVVANIIIPGEFSDNIKRGIKPSLHIVFNPSNPMVVVFLQTYKDVIMGFAKQEYPVDISLENTQKNSQTQLNIPTWLVFAAVFVGVSILPNTLTTEKEKKTLDAILVSPASEKDVIYGKSVFGLLLTLTISSLVLLINNGFIGNVAAVLLLVLLGSIAFTGLGLLIASYADSYSSASVISTMFMMPLLLLAMLANISDEIKAISYFAPSSYMFNGITDAMFNNKGIEDLYTEIFVLIMFIVVVYALTTYVMKEKELHAL